MFYAHNRIFLRSVLQNDIDVLPISIHKFIAFVVHLFVKQLPFSALLWRCWSGCRRASLSILMAIFPGEPGLAGFVGARDNGSGGVNWSYKTCKAPVKLSPPTNQHPTCYRPDALPVTKPTVSEHWMESRRASVCENTEYWYAGNGDFIRTRCNPFAHLRVLVALTIISIISSVF